MSDRWRPKKLLRERIARGPTVVPDPPVSFSASPPPDAHVVGKGSLRVTLCRHDMPWRDCRICSKPRSP